jgi:hypothetical protein
LTPNDSLRMTRHIMTCPLTTRHLKGSTGSHRGQLVGLRRMLQQQGHYVCVSLLGGLVQRGVVHLEEIRGR